MGDGGFCMPYWLQTCPRGSWEHVCSPHFTSSTPSGPPPADRGSSTHEALASSGHLGQVSGVLVGPRYMPILCSGGESASNIQKADSTESSLVFGSRCCRGRVLSRFHGCMPVCQRSSPRRGRAVVEKKDQMRTRPLDTGTGQVGMTEVSKVGYRFRHPRPGCSRELVAKACLIAAVIYVRRR